MIKKNQIKSCIESISKLPRFTRRRNDVHAYSSLPDSAQN